MSNVPAGLTDIGGDPIDFPSDVVAPIEPPGEQPTLQPGGDLVITLPGGYVDERNRLITTATVRELTGAAEEAMSRINPAENLGALIATVLRFGVAKVGEHAAEEHILKALCRGDRATLLLGIRRATYGDELMKRLICECGVSSDVVIDLGEEIKFKALEDPLTRVREVRLRDGRLVHLRLADGFTEEDLFSPPNANKTVKELNTLLLLNVIEDIDGHGVTRDDVLRLGALDRKALIDYLDSTQPGPKYEEVEVPCSSCQRKYPLEVDLADLLQP